MSKYPEWSKYVVLPCNMLHLHSHQRRVHPEATGTPYAEWLRRQPLCTEEERAAWLESLKAPVTTQIEKKADKQVSLFTDPRHDGEPE